MHVDNIPPIHVFPIIKTNKFVWCKMSKIIKTGKKIKKRGSWCFGT